MTQSLARKPRLRDRYGEWATVLRNELAHERDVFVSYLPAPSGTSAPLATLPNDLVSRVLRSGRPWEGWLTRYIDEYSDEEKISLDVGANIGAHTSSLARGSHRVIALEPQREAFRCLVSNTQSISKVSALHAAASQFPGKAAMNHAEDNRGASKLVFHAGDEVVNVIRLDDLALERPVGLMKIDVEGHERDVLLGAWRILTTDQPVIILEDTSRSRFVLKDLGYRVRRISLKDFLCIPPSSKASAS